MGAIEIGYWRANEFVDIHAIQAVDPNGIELSAQMRTLAPPEGADTALSTKYMVDVVGLVVDEICFTRG